jgi:hypothetical protein
MTIRTGGAVLFATSGFCPAGSCLPGDRVAADFAAMRESGSGPKLQTPACLLHVRSSGGFCCKSRFCTEVQKFCGLEARLSGKDVSDLIASP